MLSVINELYGDNKDYEENMFSVLFTIININSITMLFLSIKSHMTQ